jgi:hypothetical protein
MVSTEIGATLSGQWTLTHFVADQERRAAEYERRVIADWLSPLNFKARQSEVFSRRQEGSGQWLLKSQEFKDWVDGTQMGLWCPGIREYQKHSTSSGVWGAN